MKNKVSQFLANVKNGQNLDVLSSISEDPHILDLAHDEEGNNALHIAAKNGKVDLANVLLKKKPSLASKENNSGFVPEEVTENFTLITSLKSARAEEKSPIAAEREEFIELSKSSNKNDRVNFKDLLVKYPSITDSIDIDGNTVLHHLAKRGDQELIREVNAASPDLFRIKNNNNKSAEDVARENIPNYLASLFYADTTKAHKELHETRIVNKIATKTDEQNFLQAVNNGDKDKVSNFIHTFKDIASSAIDEETGNNALHIAAKEGFDTIVEEILKVNPELATRKNIQGKIPEVLAQENERTWVGYFMGYGDTRNAQSKIQTKRIETKTPIEEDIKDLRIAIENDDAHSIGDILDKFPSLAHISLDEANNTILHKMVLAENIAMVEYLVEHHKCNIYAKNAENQTALSLSKVVYNDASVEHNAIRAYLSNTDENLKTLHGENKELSASLLELKPHLEELPANNGVTFKQIVSIRQRREKEQEAQKEQLRQEQIAKTQKETERKKDEADKTQITGLVKTNLKSKKIGKILENDEGLNKLYDALKGNLKTESKTLANNAKERNSAKIAKFFTGRKTDHDLMIEVIDEMKHAIKSTAENPAGELEIKEISRWKKPRARS